MDDDGGMSWNKIVTLIFIVMAILVLLVLVTMAFIMPMINS